MCNILIHWCISVKEDFLNEKVRAILKDFIDNKIQESKFAALRLRLLEATKNLCLGDSLENTQNKKNSMVGPFLYSTKADWPIEQPTTHKKKGLPHLSKSATVRGRSLRKASKLQEANFDDMGHSAFTLSKSLGHLIGGTSVLGSASAEAFIGLDPVFFTEQLNFVAQSIYRSISVRK